MTTEQTEQTAGERLADIIARNGLTMSAAFVALSQSRNAQPRNGAEKPWQSLNWRVTLERSGRHVLGPIDYGQGVAHCPAYKAGSRRFSIKPDLSRAIALECETGRRAANGMGGNPYATRAPIPAPDLVDVLASLAMDASAIDFATFEDWAGDYGYDTDSRSAETAYRQCLSTALALRSALGNDEFEALRDAAGEY